MTYQPAAWKEAQEYLHAVTGLPWDALGLQHFSPQGGGYHEGIDLLKQAGRYLNQSSPDYSVRETGRDQPGTDGSSAIDIGEFDVTIDGRRLRLVEEFNPWLIGELNAGAPDTLWIREVIYTLDRKSVKRWDRLGIRTTGDSSHLYHTHISGFRDEENTPKRPLFERFFSGGDAVGYADTMLKDTIQLDNALFSLIQRIVEGKDDYWSKLMGGATFNDPTLARASLRALRDAIDAGFAADESRDRATTTAIQGLVAAIKAGGGSIDAAPIVAAIQAAKAETVSVVQQLQKQLASAEAANAELRDRLAEALAG